MSVPDCYLEGIYADPDYQAYLDRMDDERRLLEDSALAIALDDLLASESGGEWDDSDLPF